MSSSPTPCPPCAAHASVGAETALEHGKSTSNHIPKEERSFSSSVRGGAGIAPPLSLLEFWLLELSWTSSHRRHELTSTPAVSCPEDGIPHRGRHPTSLPPALQLRTVFPPPLLQPVLLSSSPQAATRASCLISEAGLCLQRF